MQEAIRAKENAERRFADRDFVGAKHYALKAQSLYPKLDGVSQMVTTFNIYLASEARVNGEVDYYSILGLKPTADENKVKRQYKKMAVSLHPDKNKSAGADGAFKLMSEAWAVLSDRVKRSAYDMRRNKQLPAQIVQAKLSSVHSNGVVHFEHSYTAPVPHHRLDTFWTVCTSCKVQYEYLRKYLNKKLSCKNCRGVFMAVETGVSPVNGSYPFQTWSHLPTNGYASNGVNGISYYPSSSVVYAGNGVHLGHTSDYSQNLSFQMSSGTGASTGVVIPNGSSTVSSSTAYKTNGKVKIKKEKRKSADLEKSFTKRGSVQVAANVAVAYRNPLLTKTGKIDKRRRIDTAAVLKSLFEDTGPSILSERKLHNSTGSGRLEPTLRACSSNEPPAKRSPVVPQFDARKMLIDKAKSEIQKKLEEFRLIADADAEAEAEAAAAAEKKMAQGSENVKALEVDTKPEPISINVPDPDFHDFDKDRTEECFKAKQIWALYDEEDGMPRLYCMIRQVLSLEPFKMHITYLNSKTSSEFGSDDWIGAGFTKSCGRFKAMHSDIVEQVNIFSHVLSEDIKAGRGGCVRIYPKSGDIWALYQNWSPDWDMSTPDEVRRKYEMVEVVDDYIEDCGVSISPLVKLEGYNTVYQRIEDKDAIRWIPRQEMFRFSHQVPSWLLEESAHGLPDGCWDLDPAAIPDDLLHSTKQPQVDEPKPSLEKTIFDLHNVNRHTPQDSKSVPETNISDSYHVTTQPAEVVRSYAEANSQQLHVDNNQAVVAESKPYQEANLVQPHWAIQHTAAREFEPTMEVMQDAFHFANEQAAMAKLESPSDAKQDQLGHATLQEPNPDLNHIQPHYLDEFADGEPDPVVKQDRLRFPYEQAPGQRHEHYSDMQHDQLLHTTECAASRPEPAPVAKHNRFQYTNDHAAEVPKTNQGLNLNHFHAGNHHQATEDLNLQVSHEQLYPGLQPQAAGPSELSEAEVELSFRF